MPIVSSEIVEDSRQRDARRWIRERHTDQVGQRYEFAYLCAAAFDAAAAMAARVAGINASLIADEIAANVAQVMTLGSAATVTLIHSDVAGNAAALRTAYANATNLQSVMIGDYLATLADGLLRVAFGLTVNQVTALRTSKLTPAANLAASLHASTGV